MRIFLFCFIDIWSLQKSSCNFSEREKVHWLYHFVFICPNHVISLCPSYHSSLWHFFCVFAFNMYDWLSSLFANVCVCVCSNSVCVCMLSGKSLDNSSLKAQSSTSSQPDSSQGSSAAVYCKSAWPSKCSPLYIHTFMCSTIHSPWLNPTLCVFYSASLYVLKAYICCRLAPLNP